MRSASSRHSASRRRGEPAACRFSSHDVKQRRCRPRASGDPVITEQAVVTGSRLALAALAWPGRLAFSFVGLSHSFKLPFTHTFPLRGPLAALLIFPSARPDEGADGAPRRRIQRSRLRGASDHAYEACIAPDPQVAVRPPLGAPPGGFGDGCPHFPLSCAAAPANFQRSIRARS